MSQTGSQHDNISVLRTGINIIGKSSTIIFLADTYTISYLSSLSSMRLNSWISETGQMMVRYKTPNNNSFVLTRNIFEFVA